MSLNNEISCSSSIRMLHIRVSVIIAKAHYHSN